jgi:hypothetical protein
LPTREKEYRNFLPRVSQTLKRLPSIVSSINPSSVGIGRYPFNTHTSTSLQVRRLTFKAQARCISRPICSRRKYRTRPASQPSGEKAHRIVVTTGNGCSICIIDVGFPPEVAFAACSLLLTPWCVSGRGIFGLREGRCRDPAWKEQLERHCSLRGQTPSCKTEANQRNFVALVSCCKVPYCRF